MNLWHWLAIFTAIGIPYLLYRVCRLERSVAIRDRVFKSPGWERRAKEFIEGDD
jgi:hypothetical protein